MSWSNTYSVSEDFSNGVALNKFHGEIVALEIGSATFQGVNIAGDDCAVVFSAEPSAADKVLVDGAVASHDGIPAPVYEYVTSSKVSAGVINITEDEDWQDIDGQVTTAAFFVTQASDALGKWVGSVKVSGTGAQIRAIWASDSAELKTPHSVADTSGAWTPITFFSDGAFKLGTDDIVIQARLNGASSFQIRHSSVTFLRKSV